MDWTALIAISLALILISFFAGIEIAFVSASKLSVELKKRLQTRGSETVESLNARINKSAFELSFKNNFENVVVNNNLEKACAEAETIVSSFINK